MHADYKIHPNERNSSVQNQGGVADPLRNNYCYLDYSSCQLPLQQQQSSRNSPRHSLPPQTYSNMLTSTTLSSNVIQPPGGQEFVFPYAAAAAFAAVGGHHQQHPPTYFLNSYNIQSTPKVEPSYMENGLYADPGNTNNVQTCMANNMSNDPSHSFNLAGEFSPHIFSDYVIPSCNPPSSLPPYTHQYNTALNAGAGCFMYAATGQPHFHQIYNDFRVRGQLFPNFSRFQRRMPVNANGVKKADGEECKVCGANSSGFHFGVFTCEACKGFFRRYSRKHKKFIEPCPRPCEVNISNRNNCPACRFAKCKAVGMAIENIRYGKPPKIGCCKLIKREYPCINSDDVNHQSTFEMLKQGSKLYENSTFESTEDIRKFCIACSDMLDIDVKCNDERLLQTLLFLFKDEIRVTCIDMHSKSGTKCKFLLALMLLIEYRFLNFDERKQEKLDRILQLIELLIGQEQKNVVKAMFFSDFLRLSSL
ncbi:hypothetical protein GJ496_004913 [Pomphorhynchus laevis]|nr:hypothetical protein GJ496_004913 [Pomphorhynchus laevis]